MIDDDHDLRARFQKLRANDIMLAPQNPDFDAMLAQSRNRKRRPYEALGGLVAASFAVVLTISITRPEPIDPGTWQNVELPEWTTSTDSLLAISDRAVPSNTRFEPLDISKTFGRSLSFGKGQ